MFQHLGKKLSISAARVNLNLVTRLQVGAIDADNMVGGQGSLTTGLTSTPLSTSRELFLKIIKIKVIEIIKIIKLVYSWIQFASEVPGVEQPRRRVIVTSSGDTCHAPTESLRFFIVRWNEPGGSSQPGSTVGEYSAIVMAVLGISGPFLQEVADIYCTRLSVGCRTRLM